MWQYGLKKLEDDWYELTEVYDDYSYLSDSISTGGENIEDIICTLKTIISDLENNPKIIDVKGANK